MIFFGNFFFKDAFLPIDFYFCELSNYFSKNCFLINYYSFFVNYFSKKLLFILQMVGGKCSLCKIFVSRQKCDENGKEKVGEVSEVVRNTDTRWRHLDEINEKVLASLRVFPKENYVSLGQKGALFVKGPPTKTNYDPPPLIFWLSYILHNRYLLQAFDFHTPHDSAKITSFK